LERLGQVGHLDAFFASQVGIRAAELEHAIRRKLASRLRASEPIRADNTIAHPTNVGAPMPASSAVASFVNIA
jgi:hypothetical protein